jgi:hypothetical protein
MKHLWWIITTLAGLIGLVAFAVCVPLSHLFQGLQPLVTATSIMAAGVLVRLNRGMPTLDWKGVAAGDRQKLTQAIVDLNGEYVAVLAVSALLAGSLVALMIVTPGSAAGVTGWPELAQRSATGTVGLLLGLSLARVAYVVWRDLDVVRLQKGLIDKAADNELLAASTEEATKKVENMRAANLRPVPKPQVRDWSK